ncbi:hypothetical protein BJF79_04195 [Actinomadura sp. CNU-125]|uniref:MlaD family protein n=1 Tax=Actinomadura sp. CNU-125 TaxID=1904961 RepID=UPI000966F439|nr:MCE family protein [Actinomadura sp. CNU-125]OLT12001.1 hypothetical protein BJF79_04195 [Actinomadura sp. CNU-125]
MNHDIPLPRALLISLLTIALTALGVYVLVTKPYQAEGTRLVAVFGQAGQGLGDGAPVKVRGVTIGSVESMELTGAGRARLTLRLDPGVRVPTTVSASVEPASAFGPKFVELTPGNGEHDGPFLASGATIERTSDPQDLSNLLAQADATLSAIDPTEVATIVHTVSQGLNGRGVRLGETIDQAAVLVNVAHRRRVEARRFLTDAAGLTGTLAASGTGDDLVAIGGDANTLIEDTAAGGTGRLGEFADEISDLSGFVSHGFGKRGGQLRESFRSAERTAAVIYAQLGLVGDGVRTGNQILPLYGDLTSLAGPEGKNYIRTQGLLPTDPCRLIVGICPQGGR